MDPTQTIDPSPIAPVLDAASPVQVQRDLWLHRRQMGFTALFGTMLVTPAMFFLCWIAPDRVVEQVHSLEGLIIGLTVPMMGLAGAYMGLATVFGANVPPGMPSGKN